MHSTHHIIHFDIFHQQSGVAHEGDDSSSQLCPILVDTERTLAVLQGLRAGYMVQSLPILTEEEESEKWLSAEVFSGGFEMQHFLTEGAHGVDKREGFGRSLRRQVSLDTNRFFITGLMNPELQDEKVTVFLSLIQRYSRYKNLLISPLIDQNPDHPLEYFGRLYLACFIKLHDLVPTVLQAIEQESNSPNNEIDPSAVHLPPPLADVCKVVFDTKLLLVKARQESSRTYEEVCRRPIDRCIFILENVRSPMVNVINVLHRNRIQVMSHSLGINTSAWVNKHTLISTL